MSETIFEKLNKINVSDKTDKKGQFTYLSWCYAWGELKKVAPNAAVKVYENEAGLPYFADGNVGVIVKVGVIVNELEHISYLPCMDFSNKAKKADKVDMMDVNKAVQRATVKAIALHGLGLYIYAGEDLPEEEASKKSPVKVVAKEKKAAEPKKSGNSFRDSKKSPASKPTIVEEEEL